MLTSSTIHSGVVIPVRIMTLMAGNDPLTKLGWDDFVLTAAVCTQPGEHAGVHFAVPGADEAAHTALLDMLEGCGAVYRIDLTDLDAEVAHLRSTSILSALYHDGEFGGKLRQLLTPIDGGLADDGRHATVTAFSTDLDHTGEWYAAVVKIVYAHPTQHVDDIEEIGVYMNVRGTSSLHWEPELDEAKTKMRELVDAIV